jgi:hypothetical protein
MLRTLTTAALLMTSLLAVGCDDGSDPVDADVFQGEATAMTDLGAFEVTLGDADGETGVGMNDFSVKVAMPNPTGDAQGIPNATIVVDAHMPNDGHDMTVEPTVHYVGNGEYVLDGVLLDQPGVWQVDLYIQVGETIDEAVSFTFAVEA